MILTIFLLITPPSPCAFEIPPAHRAVADAAVHNILECRFDNALNLTDSACGATNHPAAAVLHLAALGMRDVDFDATIDAIAFDKSFERAKEAVNAYEQSNGVDSYSSTLRGFALAVYASFCLKNKFYIAAANTGLSAIRVMDGARALDSANAEVNFFLGLYGYARGDLKKKLWWALFWHPIDKADGIRLLEEGAVSASITGDACALALCDIYLKEKAPRRSRDIIYSMKRRIPKSRFVMWAEAKYYEDKGLHRQAAQAYGRLADSYEAERYGEYNAAATRNKQARILIKAKDVAQATEVCKMLLDRYADSGDGGDKRIAALIKDTEKLLERLGK